MKNRVITISREFGSGGRTIGKKVAEKLGIPCYDSELIQELEKQTGFAGCSAPPMRIFFGRTSIRSSPLWLKRAPASSWVAALTIFSKTRPIV